MIKSLNTGDKVTGIVTGITPTEIAVDLGTKHAGYIPYSEVSDDPSVKPEEAFQVGQEIEVYVIRVNDAEGTVALSKKRLDAAEELGRDRAGLRGQRPWSRAYITEENKGGMVVNCQGHPGVHPRFPDRRSQRAAIWAHWSRTP